MIRARRRGTWNLSSGRIPRSCGRTHKTSSAVRLSAMGKMPRRYASSSSSGLMALTQSCALHLRVQAPGAGTDGRDEQKHKAIQDHDLAAIGHREKAARYV